MTIEQLFPSKDYLITDVVNDQLFKRRYSGYTKKQAVKNFKAERDLFRRRLIDR